MVCNRERQSRLGHARLPRLQLGEGLKRAFVNVVPIHPEQRFPVVAMHDLVRGPELVEERLRADRE